MRASLLLVLLVSCLRTPIVQAPIVIEIPPPCYAECGDDRRCQVSCSERLGRLSVVEVIPPVEVEAGPPPQAEAEVECEPPEPAGQPWPWP